MRQTRLSMQAFGTYMVFGIGLGLMFIPHWMLGLFGLTAGDDVWVRMVGLLAFILGINYFVMVKIGAWELVRGSVWLRAFAGIFMLGLVGLGKAGPALMMFAAVDLAAATWTYLALRKELN